MLNPSQVADSLAVNPTVAFAVNKVETAITALATKLGVASEFVWPILVKQQFVDAMQGLVFAIVLISASLFFRIRARKFKQEDNNSEEFYVPLYVFSFIFVVIGICPVAYNIGIMLNPEYYALKTVASFIK